MGASRDTNQGSAVKVAFIAPYFYPYTGGVETAAWEMAKSLVEDRGVEVAVHTSWYGGGGATMLPGPEKYCDGGLTVYRYRSPRQAIAFVPRISEAYQVLHVFGFNRLLVAGAMLSVRRRVAVLQPHGNISMVSGEPRGVGRSLRLAADGTISRWLVRRFALVLCLNEVEREAMVRVGTAPERTRLLRAPIRLCGAERSIDAGGARDEKLFLCVGRVTPLKYIEHAITALGQVSDARLMVIGPVVDAGYYTRLVSLARDLAVEGRISFLDRVSAAELASWYSRAVGVILCSKSEGQGLVLSEAAFHGAMPILARGTSDELVSAMGCGLLYRWGDTEELARRLEEVMGNHASFEPDLTSALAFVEAELAPSAITSKLMDIYAEANGRF